jgi:hypothetical protein
LYFITIQIYADIGLKKDGRITGKDSKVLKGVYPGKPVRMPAQQ